MANVDRQNYSGSMPLRVEAQDKACETNTSGTQGCFNHFSLQQHEAIPKMSELGRNDLQANAASSIDITRAEVNASEQKYLSGQNATRDDWSSSNSPTCSTGNSDIAVCSDVSSGSSSDLSGAIPKGVVREAELVSEAFERLAECFANIPDAYFNNDINKAAVSLVKLSETQETKCMRETIGRSKLLLREFMTKCITGEIKQEDRKTRLVSLQRRLVKEEGYDLMLDIQVLLHLKCFRDILDGKDVSQRDRDAFLSFISQDIVLLNDEGGRRICADGFFNRLDIISLQILFFLGVLPGYSQYVNYPKAFRILGHSRGICQSFLFSLMPVSFSMFDSFRYCAVTEVQLEGVIKENQSLQKNLFLVILLVMTAQYFTPKLEKCHMDLSFLDCFDENRYKASLQIFGIVKEYHKFNQAVGSEITNSKCDAKKLAGEFERKLDLMEKRAIAKDRFRKRDYQAFAQYIRADFLLRINPSPSQAVLEQVGDIYSQIANKYSMTSADAYQYYKRACKWGKAAKSAEKSSMFWKKDNHFLFEYWRDIRMEMLLREGKENKEDGYDVNQVIEKLTSDGVIEQRVTGSRLSKKKKADSQRKSMKLSNVEKNKNKTRAVMMKYDGIIINAESNSANGFSGFNGEACYSASSGSVVTEDNTIADTATPHLNQNQLEQWLSAGKPKNRKKNRNSERKASRMMGGENIVATGECKIDSSGNWQHLCSRNWNPAIKKIVGLMHEARDESDLGKEEEAFNQLFKLQEQTGKERVLLERGWTELHKFNDVFKTGIMAQVLRKMGCQWINKARDEYFFPALKSTICLAGGDEGLDVRDPESVKTVVYSLLQLPQLSKPYEVNREIRFRFRCLFSSIGHAYSLMAMVSPANDEDSKLARQWYNLKSVYPDVKA